ncbi:MAG: hypothetical protein VB934_05385, partial [Polyangiaceae bacterium]
MGSRTLDSFSGRAAILSVVFASPFLVGWEMWPDVETRTLVTTDPDVPAWEEPLADEAVTRQGYFDALAGFADSQWNYRSTSWCGNDGSAIGHFAREYALLYLLSCDLESSCDEDQAERALLMLQGNYAFVTCTHPEGSTCACAGQPVVNNGLAASLAVSEASIYLQGSPSLSADQQSNIDALISQLATEDMNNVNLLLENRRILGALALARASVALPEDPAADEWFATSQWLFSEIGARWGHHEDAGHYLTTRTMIAIAELVDLQPNADELWQDPGFRAFLDDFAALSFVGTAPNFGDSAGFPINNTGVLALWELAATRTGDPTYKELAKRTWNIGLRVIGTATNQGQNANDLYHWGAAGLVSDDDLEPAPPASFPSQITERPRVTFGSSSSAEFFASWLPGVQTNKLILTSSGDPNDGCYAVFNLASGYHHAQRELGALSLLWCEGSAIIIDGDHPYWSAQINPITTDPITYAQRSRFTKRPYDESGPGIDHPATPYPESPNGASKLTVTGNASTGVEVTHFEDRANWTVAWFEWDDPAGTGARHEERIYWYKPSPGFLWIRNRIEMPEQGLSSVRYGHVIRAHDVHPTSGENWHALFTKHPRTNIYASRNVKRMAVTYFVPREGQERRAFTIPDQTPPVAENIPDWPADRPDCSDLHPTEPVPASYPDCRYGNQHALTQVRVEPGLATGSEWFDTVLVPFDPDVETPTQAGARVLGHTLLAGGAGLELQIEVDGQMVCASDLGGAQPQAGVCIPIGGCFVAGAGPCDDGVGCTVDACDDATAACTFVPDHPSCDTTPIPDHPDGLACVDERYGGYDEVQIPPLTDGTDGSPLVVGAGRVCVDWTTTYASKWVVT